MADKNRRWNVGIPSPQDPGVKGTAITGGAQSGLTGRAVLIGVAGNIVGQLLEDTADRTYPVPAGLTPLAFKSITSATATGFIID